MPCIFFKSIWKSQEKMAMTILKIFCKWWVIYVREFMCIHKGTSTIGSFSYIHSHCVTYISTLFIFFFSTGHGGFIFKPHRHRGLRAGHREAEHSGSAVWLQGVDLQATLAAAPRCHPMVGRQAGPEPLTDEALCFCRLFWSLRCSRPEIKTTCIF